MSTEKDRAEAAVGRAEITADDVHGNCKEALYCAERGDLAKAIECMQWAEDNVRSLVFRISEARAALAAATGGEKS